MKLLNVNELVRVLLLPQGGANPEVVRVRASARSSVFEEANSWILNEGERP